MRRVHRIACLAGDGVGPELMAEASRTLRKVARMHGFAVDEVHAPFGREALTRSGHPLPPATRRAVLDADAVLVADVGDPALAAVVAQLDLRAQVTRVLCRSRDFVLLSPLEGESESWTIERSFAIAQRRRGRLAWVDHDGRWTAWVEEAATPGTIAVHRLGLAEALRALAFEPGDLDVVVAPRVVAAALEEVAAGSEDDDRLVAVGRLAENGPSLFAPARLESHDDAGHGVADPSAMLLAASLLLREGLGEEHAADTLSAALRHARASGARPIARRRTLAATTRDFGDAVGSLLAASHRNAEFLPEALA